MVQNQREFDDGIRVQKPPYVEPLMAVRSGRKDQTERQTPQEANSGIGKDLYELNDQISERGQRQSSTCLRVSLAAESRSAFS